MRYNIFISRYTYLILLVLTLSCSRERGVRSEDDSTDQNDTTLPVITLLGENPVTVEVGDTYTDAGATLQILMMEILPQVLLPYLMLIQLL